jgi:hypothetical protein
MISTEMLAIVYVLQLFYTVEFHAVEKSAAAM